MAYTPEERKEMYATVVEKCAEAAVALRGFVDAEPELDRETRPREEVAFARGTANTLMNFIGNCKVRGKQAAAETE